MDVDYSFLQALWFILICVLWIGYFVLEGFDFGVGMLLRKLGHTNADRRAIIHSIGPVWDGNEVWLITAGGATFAAFPMWYATLFSGFYLALFLILLALIVRGVSFEFWGKSDDPRWRAGWEWATVVSSFLAALLWGVAWANIVRGVPIDARAGVHRRPVHAAEPVRAARRRDDRAAVPRPRRDLPQPAHRRRPARARPRGRPLGVAGRRRGGHRVRWPGRRSTSPAATRSSSRSRSWSPRCCSSSRRPRRSIRRPGWAFVLSAVAIVALFATLFVDLFPQVMPSSHERRRST